jgi:enoyl-CoA hydratase
MTLSQITIDRDGAVAELALNRPEKMNAFDPALFEAFAAELDALGDDDSVSVILIRGEGRAFSVGWDVGGREDTSGYAHESAHSDWSRLRDNIMTFALPFDVPKPVVTAAHGYVMGGATIIAVSSDLTVVGDDTRVGWPVLPIGGGMLGPISMALVGPKKAKELSYIAGSRMSGPEAAALGWANYSVPEQEVLAKARSLAYDISRTPLDMLRIKKLAANRVMVRQGFRETIENASEWDAISHAAPGNVRMAAKLAELGFRGATKWFESGGSLQI